MAVKDFFQVIVILNDSIWRTAAVLIWCRHDLSEDDFVEFSKNVQDRIIGTKDGVAHVC